MKQQNIIERSEITMPSIIDNTDPARLQMTCDACGGDLAYEFEDGKLARIIVYV